MEVKMSNLTLSTTAPSVRSMMLRSFVVAIGVAAIVVLVTVMLFGHGQWGWLLGGLASAHMHAPRLGLIGEAPLVVQVHLATVLAAFALATAQMLGAKGTAMHRALGWTPLGRARRPPPQRHRPWAHDDGILCRRPDRGWSSDLHPGPADVECVLRLSLACDGPTHPRAALVHVGRAYICLGFGPKQAA
jgi:hypothetical protein